MSWPKEQLGKLCHIEKGATGIQKAVPGPFPLVVTSEERKSHNEYQFDGDAVVIPLVSSTGHGHRSLKRIHFQQGKFAVGSILCAVMPKDASVLSAEYLYRFLDANKEQELVSRMRGMANVSLPVKSIAEIEMPVPPLEVQKQASQKSIWVETVGNKLDAELTHQLSLVRQLRQAFLREAMQGRLVPQRTAEGHARDLLAQIKAEKARLIAQKKLKKDKPLPPITESEIPFEIPENWVWCRLGEICETIIDCPHSTPNYLSIETGFYGIDTNCIDDRNNITRLRHLSEEQFDFRIRRSALKINDIVFAREGSIGRAVIISDEKHYCLGQRVMMFRPSSRIVPKFLLMLTTSPDYLNKLLQKHKGMGAKHVNVKDVVASEIPLPPLPEQHRIVTKLEELMALCDRLEAGIRQGQQVAGQLLGQVLREALEPK
jgi:type I restriction enzyme S subunit